jgi:hypothetical protein
MKAVTITPIVAGILCLITLAVGSSGLIAEEKGVSRDDYDLPKQDFYSGCPVDIPDGFNPAFPR